LVALSFRCFAIWVLALPLLFSFVTGTCHIMLCASPLFRIWAKSANCHARQASLRIHPHD
jgi:hypothetical protein